MKLTFYGGAGEIGGNKILLEGDNTHIFLDFGMSYNREELYFEFPLLRPSCIEDLFKTGVLPRLCGLYKNAGLSVNYSEEGLPTVCGDGESCEFDAVLLSHAHMDHYGYLGMLRPDIPVYMSPITRRLIELRNDIQEVWQTRVNMGSLQTAEKNEEFTIGKATVSRYDVDHSILGASAYIIRLAEMVIAYTGDLRFHGSATEDSQEFLKTCQKSGVDILLCEGTRIGPPIEEEQEAEAHVLANESEVEQKCREILSREEGLIVYDASPADMNRMRLVCDVANEYGRTPVFDSKKAYLLLYLNYPEILCPGLPSVEQFRIALSRLKLRSNKYAQYDLPGDLYVETYTDSRMAHEAKLLGVQRRTQKREEKLLDIPKDCFVWGPIRDEILSDPSRYLIYTSSGPHTLLQFLPPDGRKLQGTYIYGKAEPFKEEMELSFRRLTNWIELCGLRLEYAHTSGHLHQQDLERFISEIDPKVVVPIHTEHPDLFKQLAHQVEIPNLGETLEL